MTVVGVDIGKKEPEKQWRIMGHGVVKLSKTKQLYLFTVEGYLIINFILKLLALVETWYCFRIALCLLFAVAMC